MSKHGNRASTSKSGSADLLSAIVPAPPRLDAITPEAVPKVYKHSNYCFLPAPMFHTGMVHAATVRKSMGCRTIFNLLGPLANPVESEIEARVIGVARRDLGPVFADVLVRNGAKKAMVVCGEEDLDEISCAGRTFCWRLKELPNPLFRGLLDEKDEDYTTSDEDAPPRTVVEIEHFVVSPSDFGLPSHPLADASPGKRPAENARILADLLQNHRTKDDPILNFVLMNTAALFVISGVCDADSSRMGDGDNGKVNKEVGPGGGRWKEGVRRAKWAVESGEASKSLDAFIKVSNGLDAV
ncbi:MAG: anthranilate phosphoribosyltransferase [Candelina submexicana]|nr:MAG: anthranilate phosphoribosyltransferase [Candelina submexicana]